MQVTVYDQVVYITSHYVDNLTDKLSQNDLTENLFFNLFEWHWKTSKHTDVAAITSK